ncbi:MAG: hypothetical protein IH874_03310 [Candidatus Dadabacteria bacterium]|nr:hypothetical protein [Candidatus Dadabacteria bacterium]
MSLTIEFYYDLSSPYSYMHPLVLSGYPGLMGPGLSGSPFSSEAHTRKRETRDRWTFHLN